MPTWSQTGKNGIRMITFYDRRRDREEFCRQELFVSAPVPPSPSKKLPLLPHCYYGYHRSHHGGTARSHSLATTDWYKSIHVTQVGPIRIPP